MHSRSAFLPSLMVCVAATALVPCARAADDPVLFDGHYYQLVYRPAGIAWNDAKTQAEASTYLGAAGHLVAVTSQAEMDFIAANLFPPPEQVEADTAIWAGGYRDPDSGGPTIGWTWTNGEPWGYTNWAAGQPDGMGSEPENVLSIVVAWGGEWNDLPPDSHLEKHYIVEYEGPFDNQPPQAADDVYSASVDTLLEVPAPGVLDNDGDPEGDPLTAIPVDPPLHGVATLYSGGSFDYTPDPGYSGLDHFTYKANDGADSNVATVTIVVCQPETGLIAHWRLDEGEGTTAYDCSGNGNHGTVHGAAWAAGKVDGALSFDGGNDYVDCGSTASLNSMTTQMTACCWVQTTGSGVILGKRQAVGTEDLQLALYGSDTLALNCGDAGSKGRCESASGLGVQNINWHHLAWVYDSTTATAEDRLCLYVNGARVTDLSLYSAPAQNTSLALRPSIALALGCEVTGIGLLNPFAGSLDDVRIYDRALTEAEIRDIGGFQPLFEDVKAAQFPDCPGGLGVTCADIDGDGDLDSVATTAGFDGTWAHLNDGAGNFSLAPGNFGFPTNEEGHSAIPGDYDLDGDIDMAIGWYWVGGSKLYRNDGATFTNVSSSSGVGNPDKIHGGAWADVNGDGYYDLAFAVNSSNRLYINNGAGHFSNQASARGVAAGGYSTSLYFADIDNDGDLDHVVGDGSGGVFENDGAGFFTNISAAAGFGSGNPGNCAFGDFDNDGDLDVFATGYGLMANDGTGVFTPVPSHGIGSGGGDCVFADVDNDGDLDLHAREKLWRNNGNGTFTDITTTAGYPSIGYAAVFADLDGDGDLDLRSNGKLYINLTNNSHWLIVSPVRLCGSPAIGAKIWVYEAGHLGDPAHLLGTREIFGHTNPHGGPLPYGHFGLPDDAAVDVRVWFPTQAREFIHRTAVARGQQITVVERPHVPTIIYVDRDATGANNGASWADAFTDLQSGLAIAHEGDQIWVAEGTYKPTAGADRSISFALVETVAVYGGFNATETALEQRAPAVHVTILSGDIGTEGDATDNSYHVLLGADGAALDGFTVTGGSADGAAEDDHRGGGIYNPGVAVTIAHCTFTANYAEVGGAVATFDIAGGTIEHCTFESNSADYGGGVMNYNAIPAIAHCTFSANTATRWGGGIYNNGAPATVTDCTFTANSAEAGGGMLNLNAGADPTVTDCTFELNTAQRGAGMHNYTSSAATISRCTFDQNTASEHGGGMTNSDGATPTIDHCILANNEAPAGGGIYCNNAFPTIRSCTLYGNDGGIHCVSGAAPTVSNAILWSNGDDLDGCSATYSCIGDGDTGTGNFAADPRFVDPTNGDFHLKSEAGHWTQGGWVADAVTSRCIDHGDPGDPVGDEPDPNGGRINCGAYGGTDQASKSRPNDPPNAEPDTATVDEDSASNALYVLDNDSDPDGDEPLFIIAVTDPPHGSASIVDEHVVYTPDPNFPNPDNTGIDSFDYTIDDGYGGTDTATVTVTVSNVNDPPDAVNDSASVPEDSADNAILVLDNDHDPDGDPLTLDSVTDPPHGSASNGGTQILYTPDAGYCGPDTFDYTILDGNGGADTATVTVTVTEKWKLDIQAPLGSGSTDPSTGIHRYAVGDDATVEATADPGWVFICWLGDAVPSGHTRDNPIVIPSGTEGEAKALQAVFANIEPHEFNGHYYQLVYRYDKINWYEAMLEAQHATHLAMTGHLATITAQEENDFILNTVSPPLGTPIVPDLWIGGYQPAGSAEPDGGWAWITGETWAYANWESDEPNNALSGEEALIYYPSPNGEWNDINGTWHYYYYVIEYEAGYDPADAVDDTASVDEDSTDNAILVLANDDDPTGGGLTIIAVTNPPHGSASINGDHILYTSDPDYPNPDPDGQDTFQYTIEDANGQWDTATVTVTVANTNDPPTAVADTASVVHDTTANPLYVLDNDTDPENDTLSVGGIVAPPAHGTATAAGDHVTYTPAAGYSGLDSFTYTASDGAAESAPATVTVLVISTTGGLVAHWPFDEETGATAYDVSGNDLHGTLDGPARTAGVDGGALELDGTGDTVQFGDILNGLAVPFTVTAWVKPRVAKETGIFCSDDTSTYYGLWLMTNSDQTAHLSYGDGGGTGSEDRRSKNSASVVPVGRWTHIVGVVEGATNMTIYLNGADDGGTYRGSGGAMQHSSAEAVAGLRTPWGPAYFDGLMDDVRIYDRALSQAEVQALITQRPPFAEDDIYSAQAGTTTSINAANGVLANDYDVNGDPLNAVLVDDVDHGTLTLNTDGSFDYQPAGGYTGLDRFTYKANDGADSDIATVTLVVYEPVAGLVAHWKLDAGQGTTAYDYSGNDHHGTLRNGPAWSTGIKDGALTFDGDDDRIDAPDAAVNGLTDLTVTCWVRTSKAGVQSIVSAARAGIDNELLIAYQDDTTVSVHVKSPYTNWTLPAPASDGQWHHLAVMRVEATGQLTLIFDGVSLGSQTASTGALAVDPGGLVLGQDQDSVGGGFDPTQALDGDLDDVRIYNRVLSLAEIRQQLPPTPPVAADDVYSVARGDVLSPDAANGVLSNDDDVNDDPLTAVPIDDPAHGSLTLYADGSFTYTPDPGYTGEDSFTYRADDGTYPSNVATVTIDVGGDVTYGLEAHWKLDEGSGTTASDSSGNEHHGTLANGPVWATGPKDGALTFNGGDDVVNIGAADIPVPWTLTFWVNRVNSTAMTSIAMNSSNYSVRLEQHPGLNCLGITHYTVADWTFNYVAPVGQWAHVALVAEGSTTTLYVNGAEEESISHVIQLPMGSMGDTRDYTNSVKGTLDDVRAYNRALRPAEIAALAAIPPEAADDSYRVAPDGTLSPGPEAGVLANDTDVLGDPLTAVHADGPSHGALLLSPNGSFTYDPDPGFTGTDTFTYRAHDGGLFSNVATVTIAVASDVTSGLVAHWKLDEKTGTTAYDSSPNANDGTLVNGPTWTDGVWGGALSFDGSDDRIDAPHQAADGLDAMTICLWLRTTKSGFNTFLSGANSTYDNELSFYAFDATTIRFHWHNSQYDWTVPTLNDGQWHHIAVTRDATTAVATVYVDGVSCGTNTTGAGAVSIASGGLVIGQEQDSVGGGFEQDQALDGALDDVRIYDRALSIEEIWAVANFDPIFEDVTATHLPGGDYGIGVTFLDADNDGDWDSVTVGGNRLFLNDGTGVFTVAPDNGGLDNGGGHSAAPGDYDNDGWIDVAIGWYWSGGSKLFHNDGGGSYTDVSAASGVGNPGSIHGGAFADVDNDGDLDLAFARDGANLLYINDGAGHFSDEAAARGANTGGYGISTIFADVDGDGDPDLLATTSGSYGTTLLLNDGNGYFTPGGSGLGGNDYGPCAFGDVDNDGDLDLYRSGTGMGLYLNDGQGNFTDVTAASGIVPENDLGVLWADVDNDGHLDLIAGGDLWLNNGDLTFTDATVGSGILAIGDNPQGFSLADIDGDGDLDLRMAHNPGYAVLRNRTNNDHYLIVHPVRQSGCPALNAKVWVYEAGHIGDPAHLLGYREILGGTVRGCGSPLYAHFGLPDDATVDVRVWFPSAHMNADRLGIARGQTLTIVEPTRVPGIIYVDQDAIGGNDGTSWEDAFVDLQDALAVAWNGDQIWVAEGTYKPTAGTGRSTSFELVGNVAIYGGFNATETALDQRDPATHVTILSGDIGTEGDASDNSYHVVQASGVAGATLDGFTITGGHAQGTTPGDRGGGIYLVGASPTIANCRFINNVADGGGGGIGGMSGSSPNVSDCLFTGNTNAATFDTGAPTLTDCQFTGNSGVVGAALAFSDTTPNPVITRCTFTNNTATSHGGAISCYSSAPACTDCTFTGNGAATGGAVHAYGDAPSFSGCVFANNTATSSGGGIYCDDSDAVIRNCTLYGNAGGIRGANGAAPAIRNCILWNNGDDLDGCSAAYSCIKDGDAGTGNFSTDPRFVDPDSGDLHLVSGAGHWTAGGWVIDPYTSPCIDAGDPADDVGDEPDPNGGRINIGAFGGTDQASKSHTDAGTIIYADIDATGANNGTSWADAYTDLQDALVFAWSGDQIWVAEGTYKPTDGTDRSTSFKLVGNVAVYGGFNATETALDQRNPATHVTILSGDIGTEGDASDNSYHVVVAEGIATAVLDGFTIAGGNANGPSDADQHGGGIYCTTSSPTIAHNTITASYAEDGGGGICCSGASPEIRNNTIDGNSAYYGGAGIFCEASSTPTIADNTISNNTTDKRGGGIRLNDSSDATVVGNTITGNTADVDGGGIYASSSSPTIGDNHVTGNTASGYGGGLHIGNCPSATVSGNTISGNTANTQGGGISIAACSPSVTHCLVTLNTAASGGGIYFDDGSPTVRNCTLVGNGGGARGVNGSAPTITNCILWNNGDDLDGCAATYSCIEDGDAGTGNFSDDPRFVDPDNGDFHLKSRAGHWTAGGWVLDPVTSPCVDAGDPADPVGAEPDPNGGRVNCGALGGSDQASKSYINTPPDAVDDAETVAEDSTDNAIHVLDNDTDIDGDDLTITDVTDPPHGTATIVDDHIVYTPDPDFPNPDDTGQDTFGYTIDDGSGGTDTATVTVTVTSVNDPPDAVDDPDATSAIDARDVVINVLDNDSDPDGDPVALVNVTVPANGTAAIVGDHVEYTPDPGYEGTDTFDYTITDGTLEDTATVTVTVAGHVVWSYVLQVHKADGNPWYEGGWVLGMRGDATDGYDDGIDVPTVPEEPDGTSVWFAIGGGSGPSEKLQTDYHAFKRPDLWKFLIRLRANETWKIVWDPNQVPDGMPLPAVIQQADAGWNGIGPEIDMTVGSQATVVNATNDLLTTRWTIRFGGDFIDIDLVPGWNLVSVPVIPDKPATADVFPGCTVYAHNAASGSYFTPTTIEPKRGYWVHTSVARRLIISGTPPADTSIELLEGWNLIGPVVTEDVPGPPVASTYGYNALTGSYYSPTQCVPRNGYWMYALAPTTLWATGGSSALSGHQLLANRITSASRSRAVAPSRLGAVTRDGSLTNASLASTPAWAYTIQVLNNEGSPWYEDGWAFGTADGATDGYDVDVDELAPPTKLDASRIWLEIGTGSDDLERLQTDKRPPDSQTPQWKLRLRMPEGVTWQITWNPGSLPSFINGLTLTPADSNWQPDGTPIDMTAQSSLTVPNTTGDLAAKRFLISVGGYNLPPSDFTHTNVQTDRITWTWSDNSDNEIVFRIDPVAQYVGANITSWTEMGLTPNTAYTRWVVAVTAQGNSDPSNPDTVYTLAEVPPSGGLTVVSATRIDAAWLPGSNPTGTEYLCECYEGDAFEPAARIGDSGWITDTSFIFDGLSPATGYVFRAQARNHDGETTDSWLILGSGSTYTLPNVSGDLTLDTRVLVNGMLNLTGPGCSSATLLDLDLNGNPESAEIAIRLGDGPGAKWLQFGHGDPLTDTDCLFPVSDTATWFTVADLRGRRLRGLQPDAEHVLHAWVRNGAGQTSDLRAVATFRTHRYGDVNGSGAVNALDYAYVRAAIARGGVPGTSASWACNVHSDSVVDVLDAQDVWQEAMSPAP